MTVFEEINSIDIFVVLATLGLSVNKDGIIEKTDGRKINKEKNYVNDFSHSRASGSCFSVVKAQLGFNSRDTFKWFSEQY